MMKRLRFQFGRGDGLKFLSHLDMMRLWPRIFRRAGIDLAYSEGFNGHPRLAVAAPLAVGWTGEAELMDVWLDTSLPAESILTCISRKLPEDLSIGQGMFVPEEAPSLQSQIRFAEYRILSVIDRSAGEVGQAVDCLLGLSTLDWSYQRDEETKRYDLRAQIETISVENVDGDNVSLLMRLKNDPSGSGRPEQVCLALGFRGHPLKIHRTRLVLA
ncbi:TIGR03936 family radical SAM-associated protein [Dehalogenimonas formicexedens]|nr:TIGR03936 family radical SAM-associated protein [Dehalogenimonas formicexedens]